MKENIFIFVLSSFIVLALGFIVFNNSSNNLTGLVVQDYSMNDSLSMINNSANRSGPITMEEAYSALEASRKIIDNMAYNNFSIVFVNDTLIQAELVLQQAIYANVLRNLSSSQEDKTIAKKALSLVDWKNITFESVIFYTSLIAERQKQAYEISDSLIFLEKKARRYASENINIDAGWALIGEAKQSFAEDRYNEAKALIIKADENLESSRAQSATLNSLVSGTKNFFQKFWPYILIFLIFAWAIGFVVYKKVRIFLTTKKIQKMKIEYRALTDLIKEAQRERFQTNKISGLVYNIRMAKYKSRQEQIKESLPVFEERLLRYKK